LIRQAQVGDLRTLPKLLPPSLSSLFTSRGPFVQTTCVGRTISAFYLFIYLFTFQRQCQYVHAIQIMMLNL